MGVFSDEKLDDNGIRTSVPYVERCEVVRHCRWVDEVLIDAPWELDDHFLSQRRIDFVALDEGASVNPEVSKERLRGYDELKRLGM